MARIRSTATLTIGVDAGLRDNSPSGDSPPDAPFRVGMHRLAGPVRPGPLTGRLFTFR